MAKRWDPVGALLGEDAGNGFEVLRKLDILFPDQSHRHAWLGRLDDGRFRLVAEANGAFGGHLSAREVLQERIAAYRALAMETERLLDAAERLGAM